MLYAVLPLIPASQADGGIVIPGYPIVPAQLNGKQSRHVCFIYLN
jgi:hypothetical protein